MNLQNASKSPHAFTNLKSEEKSMASFIWILALLTGFIGPLILWLMKKEESEFINQQGKNYFNYAICYTGYIFVSWILVIIIIGYIPLFILVIAGFIYKIIGFMTVSKGEDFVVPLSFPIIK